MYEAEQAELEVLRAAKVLQDEKDRLEAIEKEAERVEAEAKEAEAQRIKNAEEQVRLKAEALALKEKQRVENEVVELMLKAETAEREKLEVEQREKEAIEAAEAAKVKAEADAKQAAIDAEQAVKDAQAADRRKVIDDRLAQEAADKKREANKAHCKKINNATAGCFMQIDGINKELAIEIVKVIARKEIANVTIKY